MTHAIYGVAAIDGDIPYAISVKNAATFVEVIDNVQVCLYWCPLDFSPGNAVRASPIKKWPGVHGLKSSVSEDNGVKGREFKQNSICANNVYNSSKVSRWSPTTRFRWYFVDFIAPSQRPPKCGTCGGFSCHSMPSLVRNVVICAWCSLLSNSIPNSLNSFRAPMKFRPLSEMTFWHRPRRAINRRRQFKNASVVRSVANSKCTAFVTRHTNMQR